jgi:hypothetical protein
MRPFKLLLLVVTCLVACVAPAMADSIYHIQGTLTITGGLNPENPDASTACAGSPCVETLNFSFDVGYQFAFSPYPGVNFYSPQILPGATVSSSGPLGSFGVGLDLTFPAVDFWGGGTTILAETNLVPPGWGPPGMPPPLLFAPDRLYCFTTTCATDFGRGNAEGLPQYDIPTKSSLRYTVTAVPEGSTLSYLLGGLGFGLLATLASTTRKRLV